MVSGTCLKRGALENCEVFRPFPLPAADAHVLLGKGDKIQVTFVFDGYIFTEYLSFVSGNFDEMEEVYLNKCYKLTI